MKALGWVVAVGVLAGCSPIVAPAAPVSPLVVAGEPGSSAWDSDACKALAPAWVVEAVRSSAPVQDAVAAGEAALGQAAQDPMGAGRPEWRGGPLEAQVFAPNGIVVRAWLSHRAAPTPPTLADMLACAGEPEGLIAQSMDDINNYAAFLYPRLGLLVVADAQLDASGTPRVSGGSPAYVVDLVAPGTLLETEWAREAAMTGGPLEPPPGAPPVGSAAAATLALLRPWPGSLDAIVFDHFPPAPATP